MPNLVKQIVNRLMEKFKNEEPDMVFNIIEEIRINIRQSRIDLLNADNN